MRRYGRRNAARSRLLRQALQTTQADALSATGRFLALFGPCAMSNLNPECAPKRTFAPASGFMGCIGVANSLGSSIAPALISSSMDNFEVAVFQGISLLARLER